MSKNWPKLQPTPRQPKQPTDLLKKVLIVVTVMILLMGGCSAWFFYALNKGYEAMYRQDEELRVEIRRKAKRRLEKINVDLLKDPQNVEWLIERADLTFDDPASQNDALADLSLVLRIQPKHYIARRKFARYLDYLDRVDEALENLELAFVHATEDSQCTSETREAIRGDIQWLKSRIQRIEAEKD